MTDAIVEAVNISKVLGSGPARVFVFQSYDLFSMLTVAENVRLALDLRDEQGLDAMAKTEEVLASVGLTRNSALSQGSLVAVSSSGLQLHEPLSRAFGYPRRRAYSLTRCCQWR